jgi:hypothetical protein
MSKTESKLVKLWPPFDGQLPRALYNQARANFTADNIEAARDCLNPPTGFDLIGRLRRALFHYYWFKAGRSGDNAALSDLMPQGVQNRKIVELRKAAGALLSICERKPEFVANVVKEYDDTDGLHAAFKFSEGLIADLKFLIQSADDKLKNSKTNSGNKDDIARRVFCGHLLMIYENATGKTAPTTKAGAAHSFFSVCWSGFINSEISDDSTLNYLKDAIQYRDQIKASPLFK